MAIPEITKLTFRHGTEDDLNAVNPILADGEPVFCADGNILKIGDGVRRYSELPRLYNNIEKSNVIGIIDTGGRTADGATLAYIDENFNVIENMNPKQFEEHAAFKFTTETDSSGNEWVRVPKCYTKRGLAPSGTQYAGNQYFLISDTAKEGFSLSPAFKDMGVDKDSFAVSAYRIANDGSGNTVSKAGMADWTNITIGDAQTQCAKLGHMYDVYKHSHLCLIKSIEDKTFNIMPESVRENRDACVWKGIHDFCYGPSNGTYSEWLDGITTDASKRLQLWDENGNRTLTNTNKTQSTAGFIKTLQTGGVFDHVFVSDLINSDTSNCMIPDYFNFAGASFVTYLYFGSSGDDGGALCVNVARVPTNKGSYISFRAAKY